MPKRRYTYNPYFFLPFLGWMAAGVFAILNFSSKDLFCSVNGHYNDVADRLFYYATWMGEGWIITFVLLSLFIFERFRTWWYLLAAAACNLLPFFVQQLLKSYYDAPRPLNFFKHAEWIHFSKNWPELLYRSYPSGHSEGAFCFFCFLSLLLPKKHQAWGFLLFLLAMLVGYSRIYLAAHFFEDVYAGSIVGTLLCIIIFSVIRSIKFRFSKEKEIFI